MTTPPPDMPPQPHNWSAKPPRAADGWPIWMKVSIAGCVFVLAALVTTLTVILVVEDEGPSKAQQYRDALPENGLALAEPKSDSDIDQTAKWTCDLLGDFYNEYRKPQTGTGAVLLLLVTHDEDVDRLAIAWDPQYVVTHDLNENKNFGGLIEGQGRSVGILRDLYCRTIPFDKAAAPAANATQTAPVKTPERTATARPPTTTRAPAYPDMDDQGFRNSHASCDVGDVLEAAGRTADSQIVICGEPGLNYSYYYRGVRLSDRAPSEFSGVEDRRGGNFVVVNAGGGGGGGDSGESVILFGPVAGGKTHVASTRHHAGRRGPDVRFVKCAHMLTDLAGGHADRTTANACANTPARRCSSSTSRWVSTPPQDLMTPTT